MAHSTLIRAALDFVQFAYGLRRAVRYPFDDPEAVLAENLRRRENSFLDLLRRVVFANPANPYYQMLQEAGCEQGDVEGLVKKQGLDAALEQLLRAGVHLSNNEFKGRQPIVRGRRHIPASQSDFLNPLVRDVWRRYLSSGSTSHPTAAPESLAYFAHREYARAIGFGQLGVKDRLWLQVSAILPAPHGITRQIWNQKLGLTVDCWYARAEGTRSRYYFWATRALMAELKWMGVPAPPLTGLPPNDFSPVVRRIAAARAEGVLAFVNGPPSACVRIASAALEHGLDISGTRFWASGETLSVAKVQAIHRAGAEAYSAYLATEVGAAGMSCPHYEGQNTVHHFHETTAIVTRRQAIPALGGEVNALLFTNLHPSSSFFLINFELGDHGIIRPASCNCRFAKLGFDRVISEIYGYTKLTAHGGRLLAGDMIRIIEQVLPDRFGGSPSDYQLAELEVSEHAGAPQTRILLRVNPRLSGISLDEVRACFFEEVRKLFGGSHAASIWSHADAVRVVAQPPVAGRTGKVLPFVVLGHRKEEVRVP